MGIIRYFAEHAMTDKTGSDDKSLNVCIFVLRFKVVISGDNRQIHHIIADKRCP